MNGFRCIEVLITLRCGRETRPAVDGMQTFCGEERVFTAGTLAEALFMLVQLGWTHTSRWVYCPRHPLPIRFDQQEAA